MNKHTPGPWIIGRWDLMPQNHIRIHTTDDLFIAELGEFADNREANARLIAAAPELLEALQKIFNLEPLANGLTPTEYQDCIDDIAIKAIAKAENYKEPGDW